MKKSNKQIVRIVAASCGVVVFGMAWLIVLGNFMNEAGVFYTGVANKDSVSVTFCDSDHIGGVSYYQKTTDMVRAMEWSDETLVHELKHAHNAVVFKADIGTVHNEISARCASVLAWIEVNWRSQSGAQPKFKKSDMLPRDVNYNIPNITQQEIDYCLNVSLADWQDIKHLYLRQRIGDILWNTMRPMSDADLEQLFTFKIDGRHRSLYRECSPYVRSRVRDECNRECVIYALQKAVRGDR